jgi:hypothetical protein
VSVAEWRQLFAGRPSKQKLSLWEDNATFEDPLAIAEGRTRYEPQWYGLAKAFSEIERLHHEVTSSGNPIEMDLKTRYVIAGIQKEQTIESKVTISYNESSGQITKVQDKWNGKLPDNAFADVSVSISIVSTHEGSPIGFPALPIPLNLNAVVLPA